MDAATYSTPAQRWADWEAGLAGYYDDEAQPWARGMVKECPREPWPNRCLMNKRNVRSRIINSLLADSTWGPCLVDARRCEVAR